jgi:death on curing protein
MSSSPNIRISCGASPSDPISDGCGGGRRSRTLDCAFRRFRRNPGPRRSGVGIGAGPRSGYDSDLIQEAAALWESLSQNHPFVDGNKRVAVTVAAAFLRANGHRLQFDDSDAFSFLTDIYETGRIRFEDLDRWLRQHVTR